MDNNQILSIVIGSYGVFLICCGITAVIFIGLKAKTALISGGISGAIALSIAFFVSCNAGWVPVAGLIFSLALFIVFSWRCAKTLFAVFKLIPLAHEDLKGKGIAFLIIALMAVVSLMVFAFQLILLLNNCSSSCKPL
ncbi:MAG: hypothetical protein K2X86_01690 [Cytophagaceae bacterium]|nr:hypothetical protein [Cytophagaceae bacterium]